MLNPTRLLQAATLGLIVSCGAAVAPQAMAEHDSSSRQVYVERNNRGGSVRVQVSTYRNERYDRGNDRYDRHDDRRYDRGHDHRPVHQPACPPPPSGYWKTVYHPPVYRTVYDCFGRPRCELVQAGHYDRVWVAYNNHASHGHVY